MLLLWVKVSHDVAVKILAGLQISDGLSGARGSAVKLAHHMAVGSRPQFLTVRTAT